MPTRGNPEFAIEETRLEVGQQEYRCLAREHAVQVMERLFGRGATAAWFEKEDLANEPQRVNTPFLGRDVELDMIRKKQQSHLVIVADGAERNHTGDFRGKLALGEMHTAERPGSAHVHDKHHRQLAFLGEFFHIGVPHARGDIPVNGADLIAGLVFTNLLEVHAPALENAPVLARERCFNERARL